MHIFSFGSILKYSVAVCLDIAIKKDKTKNGMM